MNTTPYRVQSCRTRSRYPGCGTTMPTFIMAGSMMRQAISDPFSLNTRSRWSASLNDTTWMYFDPSFTIPFDTGALAGRSRPPMTSALDHREHHAVVMAVVRALDLADGIPAGGRAGDANRVHRGFGTRVREPDHLEVEAPA